MTREDLVKEFEIAERESNTSFDLLRMLKSTVARKYTKLTLEESSFIYTEDNKPRLEDFAKQLKEADIKEFVLTDSSTGLMNTLYAFDSVGLKLKSVTVTEREEFDWSTKENVLVGIKGLLISVE